MRMEIVSTEPATGTIHWRGAISDVETEVEIARGAWADWATRSLAVRVELMRRFGNIVRGRNEALADCIARETGKPLWEARIEVEYVINTVEVAIASYNERTAPRRIEGAMNARVALRHKPHGLMGVIGSFAMPAAISVSHILPALIAGNTIVFKPSEKAPATGAMLVDCFEAAGIPAGVLRLVIGGPEEGEAIAAHPGVDGILFTGTLQTGIKINRLFAETPDRMLVLEMGGNNPIIVWDAPDLYAAAVIIAQSAFTSAGQRCTAARRLIVKDGAHEELLDTLKRLVSRLIVAEPHATPSPFMGPLIDNDAADHLQESFLSLMMKGGRPILQMERPDSDLPFLYPTMIDVTAIDDRPDVELFGPLLQVIRVPDFDSALIEANNTRYGLCASLIGGSPQLYDRFWANSRAGILNWNKATHGSSGSAPFGGVGMSGNHRPIGLYAADHSAYPVVSNEEENARGSIGIGLRND